MMIVYVPGPSDLFIWTAVDMSWKDGRLTVLASALKQTLSRTAQQDLRWMRAEVRSLGS